MKRIIIALCMLLPQMVMAQQWDAATCIDLCRVLVNQGSETDNILVGKYGYELVNNIPVGDDYSNGYLSLYQLNMTCDINGEIVSLARNGVSNYLLIGYDAYDEMSLATSFFSPGNAAKFRQQALDIGFKKTRTVRGETFYEWEGIELAESSKRFGRYTAYAFTLKLKE